ncbi:hypothetical protein Nepgr_029025 [Nepenthes gracilis]|uniref:Uncharacterized protein n=1 Tax=Nepenthes gracilis TaxID=150966 RepID=A0AAD3TEN7_NEPGR|nr:hypothetical protein Nepgr_029025 [Nepenthes gracilis]
MYNIQVAGEEERKGNRSKRERSTILWENPVNSEENRRFLEVPVIGAVVQHRIAAGQRGIRATTEQGRRKRKKEGKGKNGKRKGKGKRKKRGGKKRKKKKKKKKNKITGERILGKRNGVERRVWDFFIY